MLTADVLFIALFSMNDLSIKYLNVVKSLLRIINNTKQKLNLLSMLSELLLFLHELEHCRVRCDEIF